MKTNSPCRLYLITPPRIEIKTFADELASALDAGDVACVQLRLKDADDDTLRQAIDILLPVTSSRNVAFIINDKPNIAAEMGCDGAHIGQEDISYSEARRLLGADAIVGVTCHNSRHLAIEAADNGADYVAFGAFFATSTKDAKFSAPVEILNDWSTTTIVPCVAIGGITLENCTPLITAGADFLAIVSAVWDHPQGPATAVRKFLTAIEQASDEAGH